MLSRRCFAAVVSAILSTVWSVDGAAESASVDLMKKVMSSSINPCFSNRAEINCVDKDPKLLNPDWMSKVPDETKLSMIAIPGTHQSGARYGGSLAQCQVWSITGQLLAGIRFLDIRIKLKNASNSEVERRLDTPNVSSTGVQLRLYHGPLYQFLTFENVLDDIRSFLNQHQTEAVLMSLNEEIYTKEHRGRREFSEELDRILSKNVDILFCCGHLPTMKEMRGKLVLIRQYKGKPYIGLSKERFWTQNLWDVPTIWHLSEKKKRFKHMMDLSEKTLGINEPIINYASASGWGAHPFMVAAKMNKFVMDQLGEECGAHRVGIIPMDFPGYGIIHRIIDANFCSQRSQRKPKDYGHCRSKWKLSRFSCQVIDDQCAPGHSVIQEWRGWTCMCSCQSNTDSQEKGCRTIREDWCE